MLVNGAPEDSPRGKPFGQAKPTGPAQTEKKNRCDSTEHELKFICLDKANNELAYQALNQCDEMFVSLTISQHWFW